MSRFRDGAGVPERRTSDLLLPEMVLLAGGTFLMGSASGREDEAPPHTVELHSFWIARFAVTNREYGVYAQDNPITLPETWHDPAFNAPRQPVVAVSWQDAACYCAWLCSVSGLGYRLPSEAEREYACRAGSSTAYPWGDNPSRDAGEYGRGWDAGRPEEAGGPPNAFGLCNMADNVHEWCADWYGRDYYRVSPGLDPQGPEGGVRKVSRGGSWRHKVKVTRSSARSSLPPEYRYSDFGFRVARSLEIL